jgi:GT2 family glycosyltransferase
MKISFVIITNGIKSEELLLQVKSIIDQNIPTYEIIIVGKTNQRFKLPNIYFIEDLYNADRGSLGGLRNKACSVAKYENLVISDDDMIFPKDWYINLLKASEFQILTTCIKNPDGTRFWDNACYMSPINGHVNLNYNEHDDYKYMSGGQSWLIKKLIWEKVKWDEELLIYKMNNLQDYSKGLHNEDTDFALRCRDNGYKIVHDPNIVVYHNDKTYTGIGKMVRRRTIQKDYLWWKNFNFPDQIGLNFANTLLQYGLQAEAADLLRKLSEDGNFSAKQLLENLEKQLGGKLDNSNFSFHNDEYIKLIQHYKNV